MGRNLGPLNIKDSYEGLVQISGSDQLTDGSGSLIPLLDVTASAANQVSASIDDAALPRRVMFRDTAAGYDEVLTNDGLLFTPSTGILQTTSSFAVSADNALTATSASYATTASFAESSSADDLTLQQVTDNGAATTNDISINGRIYGVAGISSPTAGGNYIVRGGTVTAGLQLQGNDNTATNSILLNTNGVQISGSLGIQDDITIAGDLTGLASSVNVNNITASFASFTSASIGSLRTVTGSAVIIGDEFIILNADTPTARYAGLIVYDSGSGTPATASFEWDGLSDNWVIVEESGNSGVVLTGPTGSKGSEVLPTVNTLQKGGGHHTLLDSSITDDGTLVTINANVSASGYVSASAFIGDGSGLTGVGGGAAEWQAGTAPSSSVSILNNVAGDIVVGAPHSIVYSSGSAIAGGDGWSSVIGGFDNQITAAAGGRNTLIGGQSNTISGNYLNGIFAGNGNEVSSGRAVITGGSGNSIAGSGGDYSAIVAGVDNTIQGGSFGRSVIVGGENNTINGHLKSVIIGGDSLSTSKNSEVVVPSLDINGTVVQSVQALTITSNTASLDASTGQMFTLGLQNGVDTHLELSNQVAGQTFSLKITNNATAAGTISFDSQFEFEGGTAFTATAATNAVDILTFTTFDGSNVQCVGSKNFS